MTIKRTIHCFAVLTFCLLCCSLHRDVCAAALTDLINNNRAITQIEVVTDPNIPRWQRPPKALQIKDRKMIGDIMSMITAGKPLVNDEKIKQMGGMVSKYDMRLTANDQTWQEVTLVYDYAFWVGYIEVQGQKYEVNPDFFRYMYKLNEYRKTDTKVDSRVIKLFKRYNWTVDYKVNEIKSLLPADLKHEPGEYPTKIYWAYNNELSKNIGLDFSHCLGKNVDVEIYRLREGLPGPNKEARGIVVKYNGKIAGAYIDAGRHQCFACSLDRKTLKDITGREWEGWIENYAARDSKLAKQMSVMTPDEVITLYYEAMDKHDDKMQFACITRKRLSSFLSINMDNNELYNSPDKFADEQNIESANLLDLKKVPIKQPEGTVVYEATVDVVYKNENLFKNGREGRFITLRQEIPGEGWRICEIGTGL